jgi:hypothetical protein
VSTAIGQVSIEKATNGSMVERETGKRKGVRRGRNPGRSEGGQRGGDVIYHCGNCKSIPVLVGRNDISPDRREGSDAGGRKL